MENTQTQETQAAKQRMEARLNLAGLDTQSALGEMEAAREAEGVFPSAKVRSLRRAERHLKNAMANVKALREEMQENEKYPGAQPQKVWDVRDPVTGAVRLPYDDGSRG